MINLLDDLQDDLGLSYVFVAHDLSVVRHVSERIVVMYLGKLMEISPAEELYDKPIHPYTSALLPRSRSRIQGEPRPRADGRLGRAAQSDPAPLGLPLSHPLPAGLGAVPGGRAAADRVRRRTPGRLPSPAERQRVGDLRLARSPASPISAGDDAPGRRPPGSGLAGADPAASSGGPGAPAPHAS